jgi:mRNA interferase RelE/StbE
MAYSVELSESAARELDKLENPRSIGEALHGARFGEFWKYRVGDFRIIAKIEDDRLLILVLRVGHRREIYG